jgi:putative SbcD/Mre11-related phosphoesterase
MLKPVRNHPALLYRQKRHKTLIIADLHLGWEINLAQKGIHLPSQTEKLLDKLLCLIGDTEPDSLFVLGDAKHTIAKVESREWQDIPKFFQTISSKVKDIHIIRGNHDGNLEPLLPQNVQLHPSTGTTLNGMGLFHGHSWLGKKLLECSTLLMGHTHPTVLLYDFLGYRMSTQVWIKAQCSTETLTAEYLKAKKIKAEETPLGATRKRLNKTQKTKQLIIIPCFNNFLGGRPMNKSTKRRYMGPLLRSGAVNIDQAEALLLDGSYLGTISQLRNISHA